MNQSCRMIRFLVVCFAVNFCACQDDEDLSGDAFRDTVAALGGNQVLLGWQTLRTEVVGQTHVTDQGHLPGDAPTSSSTFELTLSMDIAHDRMRLDYKRDVTYPFASALDFSEIVVGDRGALQGTWHRILPMPEAMESDRMASTRRIQLLLYPTLLVYRAVAGIGTVSEISADSFVYQDEGPAIRVFVADDRRIVRAETVENHYLRGDIVVRAEYSEWSAAGEGALAFPRKVVIASDGLEIHSEERRSIALNRTLEDELFSCPMA